MKMKDYPTGAQNDLDSSGIWGKPKTFKQVDMSNIPSLNATFGKSATLARQDEKEDSPLSERSQQYAMDCGILLPPAERKELAIKQLKEKK